MPLTISRLNSSVLMKEGAKVPELRLLVLLDRFRTCPNLAAPASWLPSPASIARPRTGPEDDGDAGVVVEGASGDGQRADFGLLVGGAGEGDCLMKGLLRTVPIVKPVLVGLNAKLCSSRSYQRQDNVRFGISKRTCDPVCKARLGAGGKVEAGLGIRSKSWNRTPAPRLQCHAAGVAGSLLN